MFPSSDNYRALNALLHANIGNDTKAALFRKSLNVFQSPSKMMLSAANKSGHAQTRSAKDAVTEAAYRLTTILQQPIPSLS